MRFKRVTVDGCSLLHLDTKSEPCGLALVSFRERPVSDRTVIQAPLLLLAAAAAAAAAASREGGGSKARK
jgi:hypothetical protein